MMLYNSISSPPSRYFFEEPSFRVAPVLSRFVAGRAPNLTATLIIADHSTAAYVVRLSPRDGRYLTSPEGAGKRAIALIRGGAISKAKKRKNLHFSAPLLRDPIDLWRTTGEAKRVDVPAVRRVRRWSWPIFPIYCPLRQTLHPIGP